MFSQPKQNRFGRGPGIQKRTLSGSLARDADFHVSQSQEENARSLGALGRARVWLIRIQGCARVPHGGGSPHPMQDRTSIGCLGSREPSQMIEFVFSASPETIRNEPPEHCPFAQSASAGPGSLRVHISRCFCFSIIRKRFLSSRCSAELFSRHEILVSALDREHVADHFSGNG